MSKRINYILHVCTFNNMTQFKYVRRQSYERSCICENSKKQRSIFYFRINIHYLLNRHASFNYYTNS